MCARPALRTSVHYRHQREVIYENRGAAVNKIHLDNKAAPRSLVQNLAAQTGQGPAANFDKRSRRQMALGGNRHARQDQAVYLAQIMPQGLLVGHLEGPHDALRRQRRQSFLGFGE